MVAIASLAWPQSRLGEAVTALASAARLTGGAEGHFTHSPAALPGMVGEALSRWIEAAATSLGLEVEPMRVDYGDVRRLLWSRGPYLLRVAGSGEVRFLLLLAGGRRSVVLLGPDRRHHACPPREVAAALCTSLEAGLETEIESVLAASPVPPRRRPAVRAALLRERLGRVPVGSCWLLRLPPGAGFLRQMRQAGLVRLLLALAAAFGLESALWIASWWVIGQGALSGRLDHGWFFGWALLLLSLVPVRMAST